MFKLINTVMAMLRRQGPAKTVRCGEEPAEHIEDYWNHLSYQQHLIDLAKAAAAREAAATAWEALSDDERQAEIAWCDHLDAQGQLLDHRFYDQWLALRMEGYVGD
jgi:hypothetical protein